MPLNTYRDYIIFDFETSGRNPNGCQLTQIAAVVVHGKKLTLQPGGTFNIEVRPEFDDEKAIAAGFDPVEQEALDITRKTREQLEKAIRPKEAWSQFANFVNKFNSKGSPYYAPIPVGYNINNFDLPIVNRYCNLYGPKDEKTGKQKLFNQVFKVDMMDNMFMWFEDHQDVHKINMDYMRDFLGFPQESKANAHDALYDVVDTANLFIRFLKYHRRHSTATKFEKSFANAKMDVAL